jgi:DNA-binding response OmpR family regulator
MARTQVSVLLVEDDESEAHRVAVMLKRAEDVRFKVQNVVSLKAALMVVDLRRPDIVLLDLSLDDFQGYDTVVEFAKRSNVPFIVLTGNDDLTMAMRCVSLGAQDYVLKGDVRAKPLERTILMALKRASNAQVARELELVSRELVFENDEQATASLLRPQVSQLAEAIEDLEGFIHKNAPGLSADVRSILDKHDVDVTIKALRDTLRLHADLEGERKSDRPRRISHQALKAVDAVIEKRRPVDSSVSAEAGHGPPSGPGADRSLLEIITRREQRR